MQAFSLNSYYSLNDPSLLLLGLLSISNKTFGVYQKLFERDFSHFNAWLEKLIYAYVHVCK